MEPEKTTSLNFRVAELERRVQRLEEIFVTWSIDKQLDGGLEVVISLRPAPATGDSQGGGDAIA